MRLLSVLFSLAVGMILVFPFGALWGAWVVFERPALIAIAASLVVGAYLTWRWLNRRYDARARTRWFAGGCFALAVVFYLLAVGFGYWGCTSGPPDGFCMSPGFPYLFFSAAFLVLGLVSILIALVRRGTRGPSHST